MLFRILQIAIPFIWFGLLGGISFLETPLKFRAPNITLPLGLGIGRIVFQTLNKIEIVLMILMLMTFVKTKPKVKLAHFSLSVIAFLLFSQTVWLLPVLDARAIEIINGNTVPDSNAHLIYIVFDAIKFVLLFALGAGITRSYLKTEKN
ncbi:MAG: hypothetical protein H0U96_01110 [Acidobacteria bacterium]|jgi:hypothetical protein|nr:hypothetical protein [Acidobacteriota bacterium]